MNDILVALGSVIVIAFGAFHYWLEWSRKTAAEKQEYIHDLVMAAEQLFDSEEGKEKLDYVIEQVKDRWPGFPEQIVRNLIEAAVYRVKGNFSEIISSD